MAKFVISCPSCGSYAEARKGIFGTNLLGTKEINCQCGTVINVESNRIVSRDCPKCGNSVIFDAAKGENAKCPVCNTPVNTREGLVNMTEVKCTQCGCLNHLNKTADSAECVLCGAVIDVQNQIAKEDVKNKGIASVIKYEGDNDTFVWKHPIEDFNLGSQLIVHESQEALFFKDGQALDLFGPGRYTLETYNIPLLEKLFDLATHPDGAFHSEIYYINKTIQKAFKWGTSDKVRLFDPASGISIDIGANGSFKLQVKDSRKLIIKTVGTTGSFGHNDVMGSAVDEGYFKSMIINTVRTSLAGIIERNSIDILRIDSRLNEIAEEMRSIINDNLDEYGLYSPEFIIRSILTPDDDPDFQRLRKQFADVSLGIREEENRKRIAEAERERMLTEAQTQQQLKILEAQGDAESIKITAAAEAEAYKAHAYAEAEEMRAKGYTYQQETLRQVQLEAMKNGLPGTGEGGSSAVGELAGLGISLGAMSGVMNMTKDMMNPVMQTATDIGGGIGSGVTPSPATAWNCSCGMQNITSKCCPECGTKRPEQNNGWTCPECGMTGITSKFCPDCGTKKPEADTWSCSCGATNITSKFCPECGSKRPESNTWNCSCGATNIASRFCPECGKGKE